METESMFQLLFERSADAIWLFDPGEGVFVDCNAAAVALMRSPSKAQLLRANPTDLSPPTQPSGRPSGEEAAAVTALVSSHGAHRFEWVARRLDGTDVPLEIIATAIHTQGRALHVVVSRDMSERRRMEADLRASEERWRMLFEQSPISVHTFASDGTTQQVNRAWERLFGLTQADLARFNILHDRRLHEAGVIPHVQRAFAGEVVTVPPVRFELAPAPGKAEPTLKWIGAIMFPILDEAGRVIEVVCVHEDITERKRSEDEIRRLNATLERRVVERTLELTSSEARLRTMIEHAPEAIVVFDADTGVFVDCNENAVRLFGLSRLQLLYLHPADVSPLVQPDGRLSLEAAREYIHAARDGGAPVFDWMHKHASGRLVPCEVRLVRLPGEGRTLVRGSLTDTTERRRREKIQQATYQISEAAHAAQDLDNLYARIHEIVRRLMPADNFYIALFDPVTELISFPYFVDERSRQPAPFRIGTGLTGHVLRTGQALLVDAAMNARKKQVGQEVTFEGHEEIHYIESGIPAAIWLGVPLSIEGQPIGVMAVQDYLDSQAYGQEDEQILSFVATQTALAIERKRGEQSRMKRAEQTRRHRNVLLELALLDKSQLETTLEIICARAAAAFGVARVGYWSLQDGATSLVCEALHLLDRGGLDPTAKGVRVAARDCPIYFEALATHEPIAAHQAITHPSTFELADSYLRPLGITSMLDVPVWFQGRVVGVLCHEHVGEPRAWSPEE
ncbi:MAG TPA: PAS domain S-box protein, partial [Candidatus Saccharimonadales bacterium]|nr:PAS domain S-box protein [Candidatus Saccharimonadales bacterium]